jgi:chemotaxis protein methyltransferase CheR
MSAALAGLRIEILATDLSQEVIEKSKAAIYSQFEGRCGAEGGCDGGALRHGK